MQMKTFDEAIMLSFDKMWAEVFYNNLNFKIYCDQLKWFVYFAIHFAIKVAYLGTLRSIIRQNWINILCNILADSLSNMLAR